MTYHAILLAPVYSGIGQFLCVVENQPTTLIRFHSHRIDFQVGLRVLCLGFHAFDLNFYFFFFLIREELGPAQKFAWQMFGLRGTFTRWGLHGE